MTSLEERLDALEARITRDIRQAHAVMAAGLVCLGASPAVALVAVVAWMWLVT